MVITLEELLYQLKRDPFYGYLPLEQRPTCPKSTAKSKEQEPSPSKKPFSKLTDEEKATARKRALEASLQKWIDTTDAADSPALNACSLLLRTYKGLLHSEQAHLAWKMFHRKFFKDEIHRELIYLWCSFIGLPAYQDNQRLDWSWRDYINNWKVDFYFHDDELREFLKQQRLPLPVHYFYNEPDNTGDPAIVDMAIAALKEDVRSDASRTRLRVQTQAQRAQRWQARINELAKMPEHSDKTHAALCEIVAGELIGENVSKSTIMRQTTAPRRKK